MSTVLRPRPINSTDDVSGFDCGEPSLSDWLRHRALRNERGGASRTFVAAEGEAGIIAGYYCLSASSLRSEDATGALRRNMPNPIPIILIGRLAVDSRFQGIGLGASLLQDATVKSIEASRLIGARALLVHALSESAASFYRRFGFVPLPGRAQTLYLLVADTESTVASITQ